jgi:diguanylate cyclase (GGDEF)-like protein
MSGIERILFVDDDPMSRRAFARAMRQLGFIVDVAENGEEALKLARYYPYAVVAADWRMPDLDGLSLVEALRRGEHKPVCVLITAADEQAIAKSDYAAIGVSELVRKPWETKGLAEVLGRALDKYKRSVKGDSVAPASGCDLAVMMVEPDIAFSDRIANLLRDPDRVRYHVVWVRTLSAAVEMLERTPFDAVLLSLELPDCPGIDAVRKMVSARAGSPIIALSHTEDEGLALFSVQAGAQDYLSGADLRPVSLRRSISHAIERKRAEERLSHIAHHDQLTGLANRVLLSERLSQSLSRARRHSALVAVFFLDLDRFKAINDTLGHDAGDELLREVARRLRGSVRETDTVARLGGDEFAVVLEELVRAEEATLLAQRVLNSFATPFRLSCGEVGTSTSIGIALFPHNGTGVEELLKCADSAMYRAKSTGRDNYQFFSEELHAQAVRQVQLESELRVAIDDEQFLVHFQPQVCLESGRVIGVEALLRWKKPGGKLVLPSEFVTVLEDAGMVTVVGEWVLRKACAQVRAWNSSSALRLRASVNISARQFEDAGFIEAVKRSLSDYGLRGTDLELEITESVLMRDTERTQHTFEELRALGVRIAIDDFGTGYSSLAYLKRFPIDTLKIDRSFIENVTSDHNGAELASAVIALGRSLSLDVVAEGVETEEQLQFLRKHKCNAVQGYLIAKPNEAAVTTQWLAKPAARDGRVW